MLRYHLNVVSYMLGDNLILPCVRETFMTSSKIGPPPKEKIMLNKSCDISSPNLHAKRCSILSSHPPPQTKRQKNILRVDFYPKNPQDFWVENFPSLHFVGMRSMKCQAARQVQHNEELRQLRSQVEPSSGPTTKNHSPWVGEMVWLRLVVFFGCSG